VDADDVDAADVDVAGAIETADAAAPTDVGRIPLLGLWTFIGAAVEPRLLESKP